MMCLLLTGLMVFISCAQEEEVMPRNEHSILAKSNGNALLKNALKFEATHLTIGGFPVNTPPEFIGNRMKFSAGVVTAFVGEAPDMLEGGELTAILTAFWKLPDTNPPNPMLGTGPAKGTFDIKRGDQTIWEGTITGTRKIVGTDELQRPLFQWKGHIRAVGVGPLEGLKLTATETTEPSPMPAMMYHWKGVITP
jgi:hypothetical protein